MECKFCVKGGVCIPCGLATLEGFPAIAQRPVARRALLPKRHQLGLVLSVAAYLNKACLSRVMAKFNLSELGDPMLGGEVSLAILEHRGCDNEHGESDCKMGRLLSLAKPGLEFVRLFENRDMGLRVHLWRLSAEEHVVVWRPSANGRNWETNLDIDLVPPVVVVAAAAGEAAGGYVHNGFQTLVTSRARGCSRPVVQMLSELVKGTVYCVGDSLGGACAPICARILQSLAPGLAIRVVTFGAPRFGTTEFARAVLCSVRSYHRYVAEGDLVTMSPLAIPGVMPYSHPEGTEVFIRRGDSEADWLYGKGKMPASFVAWCRKNNVCSHAFQGGSVWTYWGRRCEPSLTEALGKSQ